MISLDNVIEAPLPVLGGAQLKRIEIAEGLLAAVGIADKRHSYPGKPGG